MTVRGYYDLLEHDGHNIEVEAYKENGNTLNVAIVCTTCHMILLDYNHPQVTDDYSEVTEEDGG